MWMQAPLSIIRTAVHERLLVTHFTGKSLSNITFFRMEWPPPFAIYVTEPVVEEIVRVNLTGIVARLLN